MMTPGAKQDHARGVAAAAGPHAAPADVLDFLTTSLREPWTTGELRMIVLPAPAAPPERLLGLAPAEPGVFWAEGHGREDPTGTAGSGVVHVIAAGGPERFGDIRAAADRLWPRIRAIAYPGASAPPPRLFGGFAFLPGVRPGPWELFGDATFVLPRLLYTRADSGPTLSIFVSVDDVEAGGAEAVVLDAADALTLLGAREERRERPTALVEPTSAAVIEAMSSGDWADAVASVRRWIADGRAEKIVAARRTVLRLEAVPDPVVVLSRLDREGSPEVRFALRCGAATLLGATPERLVSRRGLAIRSEALAGSIGVGQDERLLASAKDAEEHRLVVDAIADALGPLCDRLDHPPEPRIQRLPHVLHLQTPFEGRLSRPVHILDLVERLHPTPAVGGTPTAEALDWIASHEPADRGWYAAPVGWFDADGDGDFVVALRSGLLHGDRAYLYAGAGIVRDSDPAAEYAETDTKLKTMMNALGFAG